MTKEGSKRTAESPRSVLFGPMALGLLALIAGAMLIFSLRGDQAPHDAWFCGALGLGALVAGLASLGSAGRTRRGFLILASAGLIVRVGLLVGVDPFLLSDDAARYAFEGEVLLSGQSPWHRAPDHPLFDAVTEERGLESLRAHVNHPEIATIYPPLAEALFALAAGMARLLPVDALDVWRGLSFLGDLALFLLIASFLRRRGPSRGAAFGWWLNPLVWTELTVSAHVDGIAALLTFAALAAALRNRRGLAACALGAAIATKLVALILVPLFVFRLGLRASFKGLGPWIVLGGLAAAFAAPPEPSPLTDSALQAQPQRPPLQQVSRWDALLGRFEIRSPGDPRDGLRFALDGQGRLEVDDAHGAAGDFPRFYGLDEEGQGILFAPDQTTIPMTLGPRRQHLELGFSGGLVHARKIPESPLLGLRQYSSRWTAHAPLSRALAHYFEPELPREGREQSRRALAFALLLVGIALGLWGARGGEARLSWTLGTLLALFWVAAPALYPWYLLWVLPFALIERRAGLFVWATLAGGLHLISPAIGPVPGAYEIGFGLLVLIAAATGFLGKKRR